MCDESRPHGPEWGKTWRLHQKVTYHYELEKMQNLMYFKMKMLQAEITMQGMIAENKQREINGEALAYGEDAFQRIIDEFGIHPNAFPY